MVRSRLYQSISKGSVGPSAEIKPKYQFACNKVTADILRLVLQCTIDFVSLFFQIEGTFQHVAPKKQIERTNFYEKQERAAGEGRLLP